MNKHCCKSVPRRGLSRRSFVKGTSMAMAFTPMLSAGLSAPSALAQSSKKGASSTTVPSLLSNSVGFQGMRLDPLSKLYFAGNGTRAYSPSLMRFMSQDSVAYSPFGEGGPHSYAFVNGNPINYRDPTGHFAFIPILVGAVVGAVVGATIAAVAEGIQTAVSGDSFDWSQVAVGAALGFISGGFGAAAKGASTSVKVGLAVADSVASGGVDFIHGVSSGQGTKQAAIGASVGAVVGLASFGVGLGMNKLGSGYQMTKMMPGSGSRTVPPTPAGGTHMKGLKKFQNGGENSTMYFFKNMHNGESRITVNGHGYLGPKSSLMGVTNKAFGAKKINTMLSEAYSDYDSINQIRTVVCKSADTKFRGIEKPSFIQALANVSGKQVEGYHGSVSVIKPKFKDATKHSTFEILTFKKHYAPETVFPE